MRKPLDAYVELPGESLASQAMKALAGELIRLHNYLSENAAKTCSLHTLQLLSDAADAAYLDRKTSVAGLLSELTRPGFQMAYDAAIKLNLNLVIEAIKVAGGSELHDITVGVAGGEFSG
ncbi:MAG: hypothetical protein QM703_27185 [Gemmatales bacterium]